MGTGSAVRTFWGIGAVFAKPAPGKSRHTGRGAVRWRLLELLNIYRILLACIAIVIAATAPVARAFDIHAPGTVLVVGVVYLLFGLATIFTLAHERPGLTIQSQVEPIVDLLAAAIIVQATGADLGILAALLVPPTVVAAAGTRLRKQAIFFAALAALTVIAAAFGSQLSQTLPIAIYTEAGLFGLGILALALIANTLAAKVLESETLAANRGVKLRQLDAMNRYIVAQLHTGVLVADVAGEVLRTNPAAEKLLDEDARREAAGLAAAANGRETRSLELADGETRLLTILPLGQENRTGYLIFVEDARVAVEQAQALKLAALGRLTAGIAHQVRNPLAAIAHANQLLAEMPTLDERARDLVRIIARQSTRLDGVVEDILSLSRPGAARPRMLSLELCLEGFLGDYRERHPRRAHRLQMRIETPGAEVNFDMGHLDHIVGNLVDNAFVHGDSLEGVEIVLEVQRGQTCLEVLDRGPGPGDISRFFEPFFTTHASGTGLGLYIARELASANGARLSVSAREGGGTRFRLEFARDNAWLQ